MISLHDIPVENSIPETVKWIMIGLCKSGFIERYNKDGTPREGAGRGYKFKYAGGKFWERGSYGTWYEHSMYNSSFIRIGQALGNISFFNPDWLEPSDA